MQFECFDIQFKVLSPKMIQKKSLTNVVKRALQTGTFNFVGQEANQIPPELFKIEDIPLDGQNWWECCPLTKMDFSNNSIRVIPEEILMFIDLQVLRMKNNQLVTLPASLYKFQTLKSLDLSRNKLSSIPNEISYCPALVELNISENNLTNLPNLSPIKTLEHLIINDNKIKGLPLLGEGLRKVEASSNSVSEIRASTFQNCSKLEILTLNKNGVERIEKGAFSQARSMVVLELKENRLACFTEAPWSEKLDILALSFNRLTQFDDFDRCPNLSVLILNDNKLKKLSSNIINLKNLKTLDISNNDLPDLPSQIGFINSLVRIQIEGNPLKAIRQNVRAAGTNLLKGYLRDRMDATQRENLEKKLIPDCVMTPHEEWTKLMHEFLLNGQLVLRGMKLQNIHQVVFEQDIIVLNLNDNKLSFLPEDIERLKSLKSLYLNHNELTALPNSLAFLSSLDSIEAQHNRLTDFVPFQKPFFRSLQYLDLSTNRLSSVAQSILRIPRLRTLLLSHNKITDIEIIWHEECLQDLEILDVSSNQISNISDAVFNKYSLNYLNFENNNLSKLPTVLGFMKLLGLKVDGNPLKLIKRQVIEKGTVAIMEFLKNKHQGDPPARIGQREVFSGHQEETEENYYQEEPTNYQRQEPPRHRPPVREENMEVKQSKEEQAKMVASLEKEMKILEQQLENGFGMNNIQRNQKKKKMQGLMIQRNKLLKR